MQETTEEDESGRGPKAPVSGLPEGAEGMAMVLAMIASRSTDHRGGLNLDSDALVGLRTQKDREAFLREFVVTMMPDRVNPAMWVRWLNGSALPFDRPKLARVDTGGERTTKALERSSKRVAKAVLGVSNARRGTDASKRREAEAERELVDARAFDAAAIEYAVSEHFINIMGPMFAMGPAWTVMRAISAYIAQDLIDEEVSMVRDPKRRPEREAVIRREREESSSEMLDALDYWSGDVEFEHELREAIAGVVKAFKKRSRKDVARRSRASMKKAVPDPELARNAGQILDGLKRPGR